MTFRVPLEVPRGCWLRNPQGVPLDGRITAILYDCDPTQKRRAEDPEPKVEGAEVRVQRPSPLEPLVEKAVASPVHIPGAWTYHLTAYPRNDNWPLKKGRR